MDGILLIDKPEGITSNNLVQKIKNQLKKLIGTDIKVGHTGTLDSFATGLMLITLGKATRFTEYFQGLDKVYIATGELGKITDTYDKNGKIIEIKTCKLQEEFLLKIIKLFEGTYLQVPPPYSSKRIKGIRAYQLAKKGITPRLKPKKITVYKIDVINIEFPYFTIKIHCSSGTYVRSLVKEIGDKTSCGAYTVSLRRTKIGKFSIEEALSLMQFKNMNLDEIKAKLIKVDKALYFFESINLDEGLDVRFAYGQRFHVDYDYKGLVKVYNKKGDFLGLGKIKDNGILQPIKVVVNS